ncbi:MAG: RNA ligase family protein [Polyangiales bacterium]
MSTDDWRHVAYPKIAEKLDGLGLDERAMRATKNARYVAREKIHGANVALHTDGERVRGARRKEWIDDAEAFFDCGALLDSLHERVREVHRSLGVGEGRRVVVFGELFGGRYPHESVAADERCSAVQTGVWYSPKLEFAVFDVAIVGEGDALEFVGAVEVEPLCVAARLIAAPRIAHGRLGDVLATKLPFETKVPAMLGLPALRDNLAEGLVVTPAERAKGALVGARRVVLKRKIDRFAEDERYAGAQKATPYASLYSLVTPARVASAWSKSANLRALDDESYVSLLTEYVVADVIESWLEARPHLAHAVHDRSEPYVTVRALAGRAVREFLRGRK